MTRVLQIACEIGAKEPWRLDWHTRLRGHFTGEQWGSCRMHGPAPVELFGWADQMLQINFLRCAVGNTGKSRRQQSQVRPAMHGSCQAASLRQIRRATGRVLRWARCSMS